MNASGPAGDPELDRCREHHRVLAAFGASALSVGTLDELLQEATELVAGMTGVSHAKILQHRAATDDMLVVAGVGWRPGVVGSATLPSDMASPPGRAFRTARPVYVADLPHDPGFTYSDLLREHGVRTAVNVPIHSADGVWGVLEMDSRVEHAVSPADVPLLTQFANLIAGAIEHRRRLDEREAAEMDRRVLLAEREVLFRELHHRVSNNFNAIAGLIYIERRRLPVEARAPFDRLEERINAIAEAHEQLAFREVERDVDLGAYLLALVSTLRGPDNVKFEHRIGDATVPLRTAVRLGMIVNETVTNSLKHAFDAQSGGTVSIELAVDPGGREGRLVVADDGRGMVPLGRRLGSGLTLVNALAEQIGGRVERVTGVGTGTRRTVTFPLAA